MAWDSKPSSRPRQSSAASGTRNIAIQARQQSKRAVQAQSQHVADPFLHDFLSPSFDAAAYLNAALPPLQASSRSSGGPSASQGAVPLAELSIQAQSMLSQLNAHTTRLTNTLTELTNDILRSGGRLAYEVELLRGETLGLAETLSEGLEDDIAKFVPGGIQESNSGPKPATDGHHGTSSHQRRMSLLAPPAATANNATATSENATAPPGPTEAAAVPDEPPYIAQLRTLTLVRSRLDSVIKTFGDAMEFVFPPSEVSVSSSFLSVSAPDAGSENHSTEEKGQQVLQGLRDEISRLLDNAQDPIRGIEDAALRLEALKELASVWKGTAEERGRAKFIESLAKMVEDRHRELVRDVEQSSRRDNSRPQMEASAGKASADADAGQAETKGYGAYGLISQLQKLRGGI